MAGGIVVLNRARGPDSEKPGAQLSPAQKLAKRIATALAAAVAEGGAGGPDEAAIERAAALAAEGEALEPDAAHSLASQLAVAADNKSPAVRESAMLAVLALATIGGRRCEPYLAPLLPLLLERQADKAAPVRAAAEEAGRAVMTILSQHAVFRALPILFEAMTGSKTWQKKLGALVLLQALAKAAPAQVSAALPSVVPAISEAIVDSKLQVQEAAISAMLAACSVLGNIDVEPHIPALVSCMAHPAEVTACVQKISATTFVQAIDAKVLCVLCPLLVRGLKEGTTLVKRQCSIIIENMSTLVDSPHDAHVFLPLLLPGLEKVAENVQDPEVRSVASRAVAVLTRVAARAEDAPLEVPEVGRLMQQLRTATPPALAAAAAASPAATAALEYAHALCCRLVAISEWRTQAWGECVTPYLEPFVGHAECEGAVKALLTGVGHKPAEAEEDDDDEEGEDLCNCEFSLAYGARILLNNTRLRLKRGARYGLCGHNGAGKSTLMRSIATGKVDGFPPPEQLRTVYVEHDIDSSESETSAVDFVFNDENVQKASKPSMAHVTEILASVGFDDDRRAMPVASLSGGWKMKLAIARAMLMRADIMLLDEPTNHLDTANVAWLEQYLVGLKGVTSIIVSHDSGFLDTVCTHIINYEGKKLVRYRGNLTAFVKQKPEAATYFTLAAATLKFTLPRPGPLDGVSSKEIRVVKLTNVSFTYPGATKPQLTGVSCACSLGSRVAVVGANGAGKSTLIKMLTGETEADEGTVWRHPNLRLAYVAQHAFHHVEQHLDKTPLEYMRWRYGVEEDREMLSKVDRQMTDEDKKAFEDARKNGHCTINGRRVTVDKIIGRRVRKKVTEYEVQWVGLRPEQNLWLSRDRCVEMGCGKLVTEFDAKEAARQVHFKMLTSDVIQEHLADFGIETEICCFTRIGSLSGGQKVKLVIAAAMWNHPHMLVLDEPTNYLDRESLGALATAIKEWDGGVLMISHSSEFTSALCPETWTVDGGKLTVTGAGREIEWTPRMGSSLRIDMGERDGSSSSLSTMGGSSNNLAGMGGSSNNLAEMAAANAAAAAAAGEAGGSSRGASARGTKAPKEEVKAAPKKQSRTEREQEALRKKKEKKEREAAEKAAGGGSPPQEEAAE